MILDDAVFLKLCQRMQLGNLRGDYAVGGSCSKFSNS